MRVNVATRPHQPSPPPSPPLPRCRGMRRSESAVFGSLRLPRSPRSPTLRRSFSATCYFSDFHNRPNNQHFTPPTSEPGTFCLSKVELLEPSLLGILPEPPNWMAREDLVTDSIARKANRVDLPLSLRIIKKKKNQQRLLEEKQKDFGKLPGGSISKAFSSAVLVIHELRSHALQLRALTLEEDVGPMTEKIQMELNCSFIWLFREVFAKTPDLMAEVMVLMVDFAAHSLEKHRNEELAVQSSPQEVSEFMSSDEQKLWDSMVEEASKFKLEWLKLKGDEDPELENLGFHQNSVLQFISPVHVKMQGDDYNEYYRTELLYQIGVDKEPDNSLLLCNYAQFLYLVNHDYDRAEECFQRAIQIDAMDGEALSQYATFLWVIRKDMWGAEEKYQQAMAAEPDNPFHSSKYACFLWSTGADDTCFPV